MVRALFDRLFGRKKARRRDYQDYLQEDRPPVDEGGYDDENLLIDHRFHFTSKGEYDRNLDDIVYRVTLENTTDYPLGNLRARFEGGSLLGRFGKVSISQAMVDPDEKVEIEVKFDPLYVGGKEAFHFELLFFDFKYRVEENISLDTEPLKVTVPKFMPLDLDEDGYRILTSNLYRWAFETDIVKVSPKKLFGSLGGRLEKIGFEVADEIVNDAIFRGIKRFVATDRKGRKWAVQVQVIGEGKKSKLLMYTFGERPQFAYNLATKVLLKLPEREVLLGSLFSEEMEED